MFLVDAITSLFTLQWTQQEPKYRPLPPHVKRTLVKTPNGDLELLVCEPATSSASKTTPSHPPIFFTHGGCGSAGVYLEWITYLYEHNYSGTMYAYSVRNHGASYSLPYLRMVLSTPFEAIQADMVSCLEHAIRREEEQNSTTRLPIVVGHSSGGGLSQSLLSGTFSDPKLRIRASGLCLVGAITSFGSYDLYWNWLKNDPFFPLRSLFHLQHPNSPLSTEQLVHNAFFGHKYPKSRTGDFKQWMPAYESMGWPVGMVGNSFWAWANGKPSWLNTKDIVSNIQNAGDGKDKICVMIGREDMMYRPWMWEKQCGLYRGALEELKHEKKMDETAMPQTSSDDSIEAVSVKSEGGVRLVLVDDSGHHVQNDVYCDQAAEALLRWANQV
ncbi:hypothetical protein LTR05_002910 [Lithohypha guttulata]|uniref:AB hydrolase-1 domain-containing protein n=1 Tax=Lithohypha guttulata TaxID=1690604 RepID=A0AAN7T404_9EURO|nr:hypothetical protein LTR05_002910 [Lithohypha guttulata]